MADECINCNSPDRPVGPGGICEKCELEERTCVICGKVYESKDSEGLSYYGDPYCLVHHEERKAPGYRVQDGCHNCSHVFLLGEYEQDDELYCTLNAPPRPKCGSVLMGECDAKYDADKIDARAQDWGIWSIGRRVVREGKCDAWEKMEEDNS